MTDLVERLLDADWNSQQRFLGSRIFGEAADRISQQDAELERLRREVEEARRYTETLALAMHQKHYSSNTAWKPLSGDLIGLLTQIDNMAAGLVRLAEARKAAFIEAAEIAEETAQGSDHLLKAAGQAKDIQGALVHGEGVMTARIIATALRRKAEETRT